MTVQELLMVGTVKEEIQLTQLFAIPYAEMGRMLSLKSVTTAQTMTQAVQLDAHLFTSNGTVFEETLLVLQFALPNVVTATESTKKYVMTGIKQTEKDVQQTAQDLSPAGNVRLARYTRLTFACQFAEMQSR